MSDSQRERIIANHPLQYGFRGNEVVFDERGEHLDLTERMNRCPTCEQWSPCDVRELLAEAEQLRERLVVAERSRDQWEKLADYLSECQQGDTAALTRAYGQRDRLAEALHTIAYDLTYAAGEGEPRAVACAALAECV